MAALECWVALVAECMRIKEQYITKLKENINKLGNQAKYHGAYKQNDVQMLMQEYHFVIMGSRWYENSPVVIQEAISSNTSLIVPNHGGMKEKILQ